MAEVWEITSIERKKSGAFLAKATCFDEDKNEIAALEAESESLERIVEILAPAKPINL
ncbi:hypothetical protein KUV57_11065 [Epibacterium sp. DP7N7-1]|nr:hypothetical protein [Epibacterium sp. DP7N7-1]